MIVNKETEFVTKNTYEIKASPLSKVTDVSNFINGENLFVISYTKTTTITGSFVSSAKENKQNVVTKEFIDALVKEPHLYSSLLKSFAQENPISFVNFDYKENFKQYGWNEGIMELSGKSKKDILPEDHHNKMINKAYDESGNKDYEFIQFIDNKNHLRVFGDKEGNLFTEPQVYDYIGANLDNGNYHLDELVEHLSKRNDVAFISDPNSSSYSKSSKLLQCPLVGDELGINNIIDDIPGYNAEDGRDEAICLVFKPNTEQIKKMMSWDAKENANIWNIDNFVVRDLLDCEKFRLVPEPEVISVVPKRKFKS
jgi:hypothetical protein